MLTGDSRLTLTLTADNVTLTIRGTNRVAVASFTALSTLQIVETQFTSATVSVNDVRETRTLTRHLRTGCLSVYCTIWRTLARFAFVGYISSAGITVEALLAAVAKDASGVVDALEAFARLSVTVAHSVRVDVVVAAAGSTRSHWTFLTQRISKETIVTQLTSLTCGSSRAVGTDHLIGLGHHSTGGTGRAGTGFTV